MLGQIASPQPRPPKYRRGRRDLYPVGRFAGTYVVCLALWLGTLVVSIENLMPLSFFVYGGCGLWLTRYTSDRMRLSPHFGNVEEVARAKWKMIVGWPLQMPRLLWQLFLVRYL